MLVDANVFLETALKQAKHDECKEFLNRIFDGKIKIFTTDFIVDSVILNMEKNGLSNQAIKEFLTSLLASKGLTIFSLEWTEKLVALDISREMKLDFDDALILVAMKTLNIDKLVSFDKDFDNLPDIKRIEPKDII